MVVLGAEMQWIALTLSKVCIHSWRSISSLILCLFNERKNKLHYFPRKKDLAVNIKLESEDGTSSLLERKDRVKYLGVHLDDTVRATLFEELYIQFRCQTM